MNRETADFYDRESSIYSAKRYPKVTISFIQYLFKKRMEVFLDMLEESLGDLPENPTMLEIGSADGILFKAVEERFPGKFKKLVGMDVSPKMVEEAAKQNTNPRATFYMRNELVSESFDVIIELGVHPYDLESELKYVANRVNSGGTFFYAVTSPNSLYVRAKLKGASYVKDYKRYKEYEPIFNKFFSIGGSLAYGFFVPKLWAIPVLGRIFQSSIDSLFQPLTPELFHERTYMLKKD